VHRAGFDDGLGVDEAPPPLRPKERPQRVIGRDDSPDLAFDRSVNPYRGCEHD